jgi:hypothetical protein
MFDLLIRFLVAMISLLMLRAFNCIYWLDERLPVINPMALSLGEVDEDEEDEDGPPTNPSSMSVMLQQVYFGQIVVECPACAYETEEVGMGIGTVEEPFEDDDESIEKKMGLPNMLQVGVILYPCGHSIHSPELTDKVVKILNAKESGKLTPAMVSNLSDCEHETE